MTKYENSQSMLIKFIIKSMFIGKYLKDQCHIKSKFFTVNFFCAITFLKVPDTKIFTTMKQKE